MASIKISELEEVVTLSESDTLPITNEGDTKQVSVAKLGDILATKEYVNKTVGELADMGFTPIIVESLPTENIQTNTIYMILGEDGEGENIYEEWMYINGAWEKVGSTSAGSVSSIPAYVFNIDVIGSFRGGYVDSASNQYSNVNFDADTISKLSEEITNSYASGYDKVSVNFHLNGVFQYQCTIPSHGTAGGHTSNTIQSKPTSIYFVTPFIDSCDSYTYVRDAILYRIVVNGTWSDNVFTCSGGYVRRYGFSAANMNHVASSIYSNTIYKTNTTAFTPTADYHPATKKYVDDAVTSAITTALESDY